MPTGSPKTLHVYANGIHVAKRVGTHNPKDYYYHLDALGSVRLVSQGTSIKFNTDYLPFGEVFRPVDQISEKFRFVDERNTAVSGLVQMGARFYDPLVGRFTSLDQALGSVMSPQSLNRYAYCGNDPINRIDPSGYGWLKKLTNLGKDVWNGAVSLGEEVVDVIGDAVDYVVDAVVELAEEAYDLVCEAIDTAAQMVEDVLEACEAVADIVVSGVMAIKEAWDNLDPGWKQWILMGISIAASIAIPGIGGILVSCLIDGTFIDMFTAISTGDWAMLGMCALAFVPGGKALKGLKAVGTPKTLIGKIGKYSDLKKLTKGNKNLEVHHIVEKRFAGKLGKMEKDMPCVIVEKSEHRAITKAWRNEISYGAGTRAATPEEIRDAAIKIYGEDSDLYRAVFDLFG